MDLIKYIRSQTCVCLVLISLTETSVLNVEPNVHISASADADRAQKVFDRTCIHAPFYDFIIAGPDQVPSESSQPTRIGLKLGKVMCKLEQKALSSLRPLICLVGCRVTETGLSWEEARPVNGSEGSALVRLRTPADDSSINTCSSATWLSI
jgi:hypothetical protein